MIDTGTRVRVRKEQNRIGGPKCAGRTGYVVGKNRCDENLLYVMLDATSKSAARKETFWLNELEVIDAT